MAGASGSSDAELVRAARAGDRDAFAEIYDRYGDHVFDLCLSVLRDRADAADAAQETFLLAVERLAQLREPARLRAWLFAIGRHEALRIARARSRVKPTPEVADMPGGDADPADPAEAAELRRLVWDAAEGLDARDRAVLDLHLRKGVEGRELAETLGVKENHVWVIVHRARQRFERALGAMLVARRGREDCARLAEILGDWDGRFSPLMRKRVARHVDQCVTCADTRSRVASPAVLLAQAPLVAAPAVLRERVLRQAAQPALVGHCTVVTRGWRGGFPPPVYPRRRWSRRLTVATALAVTVLLGGTVTVGGAAGSVAPWFGLYGPASGQSDVHASTAPAPSVGSPPAAPPPPTSPPTGTPGVTPTVESGPGSPAVPDTPPTTSVPVTIGPVSAEPAQVREENGICHNFADTTVVTATVNGPTSPEAVYLHWSVADVERRALMTPAGGDTYVREIPPFPGGTLPQFETAPVTLRVEVVEAGGTVTSHTAREEVLTLRSCPFI